MPQDVTDMGYTIPKFPEILFDIHRTLIEFKEDGKKTTCQSIGETIGRSSSTVSKYLHHLKSLGAIDFKDRERPLNIRIVVRENIESITRKIFMSEGYVFARREGEEIMLLKLRKKDNGKYLYVRLRDGYYKLIPQKLKEDIVYKLKKEEEIK